MRKHMPFIRAHDLSYTYPDGTKALSNISFTIERGEKIALIGHNGSGKSTMLLLLAALMLPTGGTLALENTEYTKKTQRTIRNAIGILFSQVEYQFIMPDCLNDVMLSIKEGTKEERKAAAMEYLSYVNLQSLSHHNPLFLSSGQMKRAALASVLAKKPKLLLLDEPLANLDRPSSDAVMEILESLDITTVFATHSLHAARYLARRTIVLDKGQIRFDGPSTSREIKTYYRKILL